MRTNDRNWAVVLAAGDGNRLAHLTTNANGTAIPKQYCALTGETSMLQDALTRAARVIRRDRVTAIVARQHECWWRQTLRHLPDDNVIVQPQNRGTGIGILLPLLHILNRDPDANIVLIPSDHYVQNERILSQSISHALDRLERRPGIVLLGIEPDHFDSELGYIVPGASNGDGTFAVRLFIEKPGAEFASSLKSQRAVWNSFVIAARGQDLLNLYAERFPDVVVAMAAALSGDRRGSEQAISELYRLLPEIDFSRHVISESPDRLRLLAVPQCGWSDLGTPDRVAQCLAGITEAADRQKRQAIGRPVAFLKLADVRF